MRLKQLAAVMTGSILLFGSLPYSVLAEDNAEKGKYDTKDEAIYGNLAANGSLEDMYVVNTFHIKKPGTMKDHGDYKNVRNLSNLSDIEQDDDKVRFQAEKKDDDFYYQGYLENQPLPWDIEITYLLDGEKIDPDELAGKDGSLEIQIETSANDDVNKTFFENYMMQIEMTLDPSSFDDIQAPDGTKAKEGKNTNVTFTAMPDDEEEFVVSADVTDLEMDPINISATPASMPMDDPDIDDMKGDMKSLSSAIRDIDDGVDGLRDGITDLNSGAEELSNGSNDYQNGINELSGESEDLVSGSEQIRDTLNQVEDAVQGGEDMDVPNLNELQEFPDKLHDLSDSLEDAADGLETLNDNYDDAYDNLNQIINNIPDDTLSEEDMEALRDADVDDEVVDQLMDTYESAQNVKESFPEVDDVFESVKGTLDETSDSVREMEDNVNEVATEIENGMDQMDEMDSLTELQDGVTDMASEYQTFHNGLVEYTDGVGELASNYQDIDEGIQGLADGSSSLDNGANELKDGTKELRDNTSDMPGEMQSEVDDMMDEYDGSDFEPVSFVSDQNKDIDVVQFALKTDPIEVEEPETTDENEEKEDKNLWEKFLDLFR